MSKLTDNQINDYLNKLLDFVNGLPLNEKGKSYLRSKIVVDFLDTWQFDDEANSFTIDEYLSDSSNPQFIDVQTTYGIRNTTQAKRYINDFIVALKKSRTMALQNRLNELDKLHPAIKAEKLTNILAKVTRSELFAKYGIEEIKEPEWNKQLKEVLGTEITFAKEQAELLTQAPNPLQLPQAKDDEILIVEELENRLAIEAVDYNHKFTELWQEYQFDPTYFDSFISGPLFNEFTKSVYDRIRPLNNQEINRYLSLSLQQFKTHTPPKRHKAFLLNYYNTYWYPNYMEYKEEEYMVRYATHVWKHYTNHFNLFRDAVQKIYDDFKAGFIGTPGMPLVSQEKKTPVLSFKYINLNKGFQNLTDLMNFLKRNKFIADDTSLSTFRSVFSEKEIEQKIIWTGNLSELTYFIKILHNTAKKVKYTKLKIWTITINCFRMADGTVLTNEKLKGQHKPARAHIIEKAVNIL